MTLALCRPAFALLVALALAAVLPAEAEARRTPFSDMVKASRLLAEWRYEEAREVVAKLAEKAPNTPETRYLQAELAYVNGDYQGTLERIKGLDDSAAAGNVGRLRSLASSTLTVTGNFVSRRSPSGRFEVFYAPGKDEAIVDLAIEVLERAHQAFQEDFDYVPPERIRVELLSRPADLAKLSTLTETEIETTGTIALCKYGKLMVVSPRATIFGYPWMDTLVHEYVHYIVSRMSHDNVPIWLHEGLARFQQSRWRKNPDPALPATDEHLLATALKARKLITFDEMHPSMAKLPSQEAAALAFAEVFTMVAYIHSQVGYSGIRQVIELQRDGKGPRRAVAEVLGKSWQEVERDWKNYLWARNLKSSKALAGRAKARRIRFERGEAGENSENIGVDEVASEKARKHARLGGMLRARGMTDAAVVEYEKALAITGPEEPFVAARLSRTYLEMSQHDKAVALARPLMVLDENDATPAVTVGTAEMARGNTSQATAAFEAALRISPFDPVVRCSLAELYGQAGDTQRAKREEEACGLLR